MNQQTTITGIPTTWVGPLRVSGEALAPNGTHTEVAVPLATYETPLWPSVGRGASISREIEGGIRTVIVDERMTRSVLFVAESAIGAEAAARAIRHRTPELESVVEAGSNHCRLIEIHPEIVGNLLFVRFAFRTNDASGHNMVTQAAEQLMDAHLFAALLGMVEDVPAVDFAAAEGTETADGAVALADLRGAALGTRVDPMDVDVPGDPLEMRLEWRERGLVIAVHGG